MIIKFEGNKKKTQKQLRDMGFRCYCYMMGQSIYQPDSLDAQKKASNIQSIRCEDDGSVTVLYMGRRWNFGVREVEIEEASIDLEAPIVIG